MGNKSSSSTNQTITNNTVNKNTLNMLNETIMNTAVSTMISTANSCSSAVNLTNDCGLTAETIDGDLNINANQANKASVNFSCLAQTESVGGINASMSTALAAELKALNGTAAAAQLNSLAGSSNNSGFGAFGGSSSSNSNTTVNNNVTNETVANITNKFQQNISNNFTQNTLNECVAKTTLSNTVNPKVGTVKGNANITCVQSNTLEQVQHCEFLSAAVNKSTTALLQELGLKVSATSETSSKTEASNVSKSENVSTGPIQDLFNGLSNVIGSVTGAASLGAFGPILSPICCCCCLLIIFLCLFMVFKMVGSGETGTGTGISGNLSDLGLGQSTDIDELFSKAKHGAKKMFKKHK